MGGDWSFDIEKALKEEQMAEQRPSIGRIVHYVEPTTGEHHAAVITKVHEGGVGEVVQMVNLSVLGQDFIAFKTDICHADPDQPGGLPREATWHWPERA